MKNKGKFPASEVSQTIRPHSYAVGAWQQRHALFRPRSLPCARVDQERSVHAGLEYHRLCEIFATLTRRGTNWNLAFRNGELPSRSVSSALDCITRKDMRDSCRNNQANSPLSKPDGIYSSGVGQHPVTARHANLPPNANASPEELHQVAATGSKVRLLPRDPKSSKARIFIKFRGPQALPDKDGTATFRPSGKLQRHCDPGACSSERLPFRT